MTNPYQSAEFEPANPEDGTRAIAIDRWLGLAAIVLFFLYFAIILHILNTEGNSHPIWECMVLPTGFACLAGCIGGFLLGIKNKRWLLPMTLAFIGLLTALHLSMLLFPQWH